VTETETAATARQAAELGRATDALGLATDWHQATFWSGLGRLGDEIAAAWTKEWGGKTLETVLRERGITLPAYDPSNPASVAAWENASREFALSARGDVRVLLGDNVSPTGMWNRIEFDALKNNQKVTSITAINPETGVMWRWER
jgi:hypothetical protein